MVPPPSPLYTRRILLAILTERARDPSALYSVNSSPRVFPGLRNTARIEKSYGNPSRKVKIVVSIDEIHTDLNIPAGTLARFL